MNTIEKIEKIKEDLQFFLTQKNEEPKWLKPYFLVTKTEIEDFVDRLNDIKLDIRQNEKSLNDYNENVKYMLGTTKNAIHSCYKGGSENYLESLCINYTQLQREAGRYIPAK